MKKSFATLVAVLATLCTTSTALAETPTPASGETQKTAIPGMPQLHYSAARADVYAPKITRTSNNVTVSKGQDVNIHVTYEGKPVPTAEIYFNDKPLNLESSKYGHSSDTYFSALTIRNAQPVDSGEYTFKVKNMLGESQTSIQVTVN